MGKHEFPGAVAAHDQDDAMREQAGRLAGQMNDWLTRPGDGWPVSAGIPSDLIEWLRSARDILAAVARE